MIIYHIHPEALNKYYLIKDNEIITILLKWHTIGNAITQT